MYRPDKVECCKEVECVSGRRNNYFEGKRLTADSFRVEQSYLNERRRLLNRAIFGWGVVYGFRITGGDARLTIGAGLALDECGRELLQAGETSPKFDDLFLLDENYAPLDREHMFPSGYSQRYCWQLSVHYAEQLIGPVKVDDPCHCEHKEWEHVCETVRYSLRRIPCHECCRECDCELTCECASGGCCDEHECGPLKRGGCRCICDYLTDLQPGKDCGPLSPSDEPCGTVSVDRRHGVPLACVKLVWDEECHRWTFDDEELDPCGPRPLVKRNDLLFDLIRGCDLTRISEIGWAPWHRRRDEVSFDDFSAALGWANQDHGQDEYVTRDFWVRFSRPVRKDTVRPDCFAMTILSGEREGGWWQVLRVPILRVDTTFIPPQPKDPPGHVRGAKIVVDGAWLEDGVRGRRSLFIDSKTRVEIEVRGDFIVDCNGQTVDANAIGLSPAPTGNGAPGDMFISTFCVGPREVPPRGNQYGTADSYKGDSYKGASS